MLVALPLSANATIFSGIHTHSDVDGDGAVDDQILYTLSFDVTAGTTVTFDSAVIEETVDFNGDGYFTAFDMQFTLLDSIDAFIYYNDDYSPAGRLATMSYDSYISHTFASAGTYELVFGQLYFDNTDAANGYQLDATNMNSYGWIAPDGDLDWAYWQVEVLATGGRISNFSMESDVPEPTTIALMGLGLAGIGWRRKAKAKR